MKYVILGVLMLFSCAALNARKKENDFKIIEINKRVDEYPDKYDLNSPLNSFISFKYLQSQGKQGLYRAVNSYRIKDAFPKPNAPDIEIKKDKRDALLQTRIREIIIYKDSVAGLITDYLQPPMCIITYLSLEDGKWLNAGEGLGNDLIDAREKFKDNSKTFLQFIYRTIEFKTVSTDTSSFINYLKKNGKTPKEFVLQSLMNNKIVVYGEIHRRKSSWDLMKSIINDPRFAEHTGTIFMELSSDKQDELNTFFANGKLDTEIILDIFRSVQIYGWYDKGMYEFLLELWKLNQKLPQKARIQVVAVDEPRPFDSLKNFEELEYHFNTLDRNEQMAQNISSTIKNQKGKRNNLFIVGDAHAYKSLVPGIASGREYNEALPTAAAQLSEMFSQEDVFTIFPHCPIISNDGKIYGKIRNGLFDQVFAEMGNGSIAFNLKDSPFGKEPFDGIYEIRYSTQAGSFEKNYDAYLFLEPLEIESEEYLFNSIITEDYLKELKRRAKMTNNSLEKWFDVDNAIIENIKMTKEFDPSKKRWTDL